MTALNDNRPLPAPAGNWALFLDIDGTILDIAPTPDAVSVPAELDPIRRRIAREVAGWDGVVLETKTFGIGVHYRLAPHRAVAVRELLESIVADAPGHFELLPGKMLFELKTRGPHKGRVVAAFMAVAPFAGRVPVFIGDDRTDEDGFREALSRGGCAVQVGPGLSSVATCAVPDPQALRDWLRAVPGILRGAVA